ncbi:MAG: helix-turn-helix transcriptional regulator [Sandaracinus sp.]
MTKRSPPPPPAGLTVRPLQLGDDEVLVFAWPLEAPPRLPDTPTLTAAERAVGQMLLEGHSDAAIAEARQTSVRTVGKQAASVYRKLGVSSRRELWALCRGGART